MQKGRLKSISFHVGKEVFQYHGYDEILRGLKQKLSPLVFQMKIQDEYKAETVLGRGSYATVLELTHIVSQKQYAAKCIDQQRILEKKLGYQQLLQEIETMRLLSENPHINILQLKELYIGNQNYYIVMELARGGSLLSMMKRRQQLFNRQDIRIIMRQLLDGLAFIHAKQIIHRDLKPENILFLTKDIDSLKIADFGLAQNVNQHPFTYPKCGTPGFVAPEILEQDSENAIYDQKCDIFSAGVILYILLVGEPLFERKERREQLELNRKCEINLAKYPNEILNETEKDILEKMLAKDPQFRWNAEQLIKHKFINEDMIDYEIDIPKMRNMMILSRSRMPTFQKNPFMMYKNNSRDRNISFISRTLLRLDKSSDNVDKDGQFSGL
ncbi:hypothetical protein pb186bvf_010780 [Paramecium bursaria]